MKILLIAPYPPPYGGIANWVVQIKEYVDENCDDIKLSVLNVAPKKRSTEGRNLWDRIIVSGFEMLFRKHELKKHIRMNRPDVIHMTTSGQFAVIRDILLIRTAKKYGIPVIYHIRFGRITDIACKNTREWQMIKKAMQLASTVMTIDRATLETVKEKLPGVNAVNVPNPIDICKLPSPQVNKSKNIMFLGWVVKTKGIEELLEAWEKVYREHNEWTLNIVGPYKTDYYEVLRDKYTLDGVVFLGEKKHDEAMELLNNSEIFILPSYTEGFPNSVLEAMALGKPVIATRVGAIPDMLDDGCGILINPCNSEDILESLNKLMKRANVRANVGKISQNKVYNKYTIERVFEHYRKLWLRLSKGIVK